MQGTQIGNRSHTHKFLVLRKEKNAIKQEAIKRINAKLKLEMHNLHENKGSRTAKSTVMDNYFTSFMATKKAEVFYDSKGEKIDLSKIPACIQCQSLFSFFDSSPKLQCPTCKRIVCNKCLNSKYFIPLPQSLGGKLELCKRCFCLKEKETAILEFKKKIEETKNNRLILWYNTLISLRKEIEKLMPHFKGAVFSLNSQMIDELTRNSNEPLFLEGFFGVQENAREHEKNIEKHFRVLQERLNKISNAETVTTRDEQIKKLIKMGTVNFLRIYLPEYQGLCESFRLFMANPIVQATVTNYHLRLEHKKEKEKLEKEKLISTTSSSRDNTRDSHEKSSKIEENGSNHLVQGPSIISYDNLKPLEVSSLITQKNQPTSWLESLLSDGKKSKTIPKSEIPHKTISTPKPIISTDPQISLVKPIIESVKPAVVPISGEVMIDIEGMNFEEGLEVIIAGERIGQDDVLVEKDEDTGKSHVFLEVPPSSEGVKTIIIINPNKNTAILENVLLYVNDPEILKEFQSREAGNVGDNYY